MKLIIILLLLLTACRPEYIRYKYCWHCEGVSADSSVVRSADTCTETKTAPSFNDQYGNVIETYCEEK